MSRSLCRLGSSVRSIVPLLTNPVLLPSVTLSRGGSRSFAQAALKARSDHQPKSSLERRPHRDPSRVATVYADEDDFDSREMSAQDVGASSSYTEADGSGSYDNNINTDEQRTWSRREPDPHFADHLDGLFPTLRFPPELARRILTHGSHPAAIHGHNAGLSFMGRRVLESYLLLLLSSSQSLEPKHDLELIASRTLNTYALGESIGPIWGLGRVLRWTPTVAEHQLKTSEDRQGFLRNVGLYKVQGDAVAAVMGGIFQQFGASVAHRVFHTRLLLHLISRKAGGLPEVFRADALSACERMGGVDGNLLITPSHAAPATVMS